MVEFYQQKETDIVQTDFSKSMNKKNKRETDMWLVSYDWFVSFSLCCILSNKFQ